MLVDTFNRPVKDLRISVTDRCNFRCTYCMPFDEYTWINKKEILSFEEIARLAKFFVQLGVDQIRLTGGEPLVRQDLEKLIDKLSSLSGLNDLSLTTNGSLLADKAPALKAAGLKRINVSIDTLNPEKFKRMTKRGDLSKVLDGAAPPSRIEGCKRSAQRGVAARSLAGGLRPPLPSKTRVTASRSAVRRAR